MAATATTTAAVQQDWDNRAFNERLQLQVVKIGHFVADFEASTRRRLAAMNGKLESLERQLLYAESRFELANNDACRKDVA
eukprot:jgi/Chlat1/5943/Chrsp4S06417